MERIIKENMSSGDLRLLLTPPDSAGAFAPSLPSEPARGKLYAYRILRADDIAGFAEPWFVDLGFSGRREAPPSSGTLDHKYFYLSEKTEHGYCLETGDLHADELFTFRGQCRRVIDGDTLLVLVDQGFGVWSQQRLRLAGIDAPELSTLPGQRARKWVQDALKGCVDLVVKTYKSDKWDRYLVDVFYSPGETDPRRVAAEGIWLNRQLVQEGVATVWKG